MKSKDESELDDGIKEVNINDVKKVASICTKLNPDELKCVLTLKSDEIYHIIGDLIFNCCLNNDIYPKIKKCRKYKKVKKEIDINKDKIFKLLKYSCCLLASEKCWQFKSKLSKKSKKSSRTALPLSWLAPI